MNLGGTVRIVASIAADGSAKKGEGLGGSPLLIQAAASAVSQWKFAPGGQSTETVELHFTPYEGAGSAYLPSTSLAMVASCMFDVPS